MKKWRHLSNATDDMLLAWHKCSARKKLQWLESMRQFYQKAVPVNKRLDHRLETYHKNPSAGSPWAKVKKRILSKKTS